MSAPDANVSMNEALAAVPHESHLGALVATSSVLEEIWKSFPRIDEILDFKVGIIRIKWDASSEILALCPHIGDEHETLLGPCNRLPGDPKGVNWLGAFSHTGLQALLEQARKRNDVTDDTLKRM